jgi:hypothetical protein
MLNSVVARFAQSFAKADCRKANLKPNSKKNGAVALPVRETALLVIEAAPGGSR